MAFIDILSLILSFGIVLSIRFLFPRNIVPLVSTSFEEALTLLERAEAIDIPYLAVDERQLAFLTNTNARRATTTALPAPAADTVIPMTNVTEPTPPPHAVLSVQLPGYH
ncbi:hypothetical protein V8E52_000884 [Russula decolorans]